MELNQLAQFKVLAETENMHAAAEQLFITQPALSRSLAKLESELGCTLFTRSRQRIQLNDEGRIALACVDRIFEEVDQLRTSLQKGEHRKVRLQSEDETCLPFFSLMLSADHPLESFTCTHAKLADSLDALSDGTCDMVFCNRVVRDPRYFTTYISTDQVFVSLPQDDPAASLPSLDIHDLTGRRIVYTNADGYLMPLVLREMRERSVAPARVQALDFAHFLLAALSSGDIHFVSPQTYNEAIEEKRVVLPLVNPTIKVDYYAICRRSDTETYLPYFSTLQKRFWNMSDTEKRDGQTSTVARMTETALASLGEEASNM